MASGHVSRTRRPNTWLLRPDCNVQKVLANVEPSTHGTKPAHMASRQVAVRRSVVRGLGRLNGKPLGRCSNFFNRRHGTVLSAALGISRCGPGTRIISARM